MFWARAWMMDQISSMDTSEGDAMSGWPFCGFCTHLVLMLPACCDTCTSSVRAVDPGGLMLIKA